MNIMIIGSGGREAAIASKIKENPSVENLYVLPGNDGMKGFSTIVDIKCTNYSEIKEFALSSSIDFAIISPDDPLVAGLVDILEEIGIECFGPSKRAALIEGSKSFAKSLMEKYNIPTAFYKSFTTSNSALSYAKESSYPLVIKADGLALGKGVSIVQSFSEAKEVIIDLLDNRKFLKSSDTIIIEEFLEGPEVSMLCFTDGESYSPMISSMDHKRIYDGDRGPNTGGMGAVAPNPYYTEAIHKKCEKTIYIPTIEAMQKEMRVFKGCLYFGLMLTKDGPKVIEYNCRFGDPETQAILPLLKSDLLTIMKSCREGTLSKQKIEWETKSSACVVLSSKGYPLSSTKGLPITINPIKDAFLFTSAVKDYKDGFVTNGGRVLSLTCTAPSLKEALKEVYQKIDNIEFKDKVYRKDIGKVALQAK